MASRPRVRLDDKQVRKVLTSNGVEYALDDVSERILADAKDRAPVDSGEYRDSLKIVKDVTDRSVRRIIADSDHGLAVEARDAVLGVSLNMNHRS